MLIPLADGASEIGAEIGVFGGSGFYDFLDDAEDVRLHTPYGEPAAPTRHEPVTMEAVFAVMRQNVADVQRLITATLPSLA